MSDIKVIYDALADRIWIGFEQGDRWYLEFEDNEVNVTARTKRGLKLPTETLIIVGDL